MGVLPSDCEAGPAPSSIDIYYRIIEIIDFIYSTIQSRCAKRLAKDGRMPGSPGARAGGGLADLFLRRRAGVP
jgi:hypothetical protein